MNIIRKFEVRRIERALSRVMKMEYMKESEPFVCVEEVLYDNYGNNIDIKVRWGTSSSNYEKTFYYYGLELLKGQFLQAIIDME